MISSLWCWLGLHNRVDTHRFVPSITAKIVTEYEFRTDCARCGKVLSRVHEVWNGEDFVPAEDA